VFVWGLIGPGTLLALAMLAVQARAHRAMLRELESSRIGAGDRGATESGGVEAR
jgi:heme exporter protein D